MDRRRRNIVSRTAPSWVEGLEKRVVMSVAVAAVVADRFEPNDSYAAATDLGTLGDRTESGLSIHASNNNDYFKFKAAASGAVSIRFTFDQSQGDIDAFLLDSNRLLMDSAATTSSPERLDQTLSAGQTYYIKVIGFGGAVQPSYNMAIDGPSAPTGGDSDDQTTEARPISVGGSVTDSVSNSTDVDLFKFTVAAGKKLAFDLDRTSGSSLDSFVRLFNASGSRIASNGDANAPGETASPARESYLAYTFTTAGTYYVGVSGAGNQSYSAVTGSGDLPGSTGGYTLRVTGVTTPTTPPDADDQTAEARSLSIGGSITDAVANPTDVDLFKFTVKAGQKLGFDVDPASGSTLDSFLRVFNSSGSRIASNDNRAAPGETLARSSYLDYTFATAGTYYVGVSGAGNQSYSAVTGSGDLPGSTGGYRLFIVNRTTTTVAAASLKPLSAAPAASDPDVLLGRVDLRLL